MVSKVSASASSAWRRSNRRQMSRGGGVSSPAIAAGSKGTWTARGSPSRASCSRWASRTVQVSFSKSTRSPSGSGPSSMARASASTASSSGPSGRPAGRELPQGLDGAGAIGQPTPHDGQIVPNGRGIREVLRPASSTPRPLPATAFPATAAWQSRSDRPGVPLPGPGGAADRPSGSRGAVGPGSGPAASRPAPDRQVQEHLGVPRGPGPTANGPPPTCTRRRSPWPGRRDVRCRRCRPPWPAGAAGWPPGAGPQGGEDGRFGQRHGIVGETLEKSGGIGRGGLELAAGPQQHPLDRQQARPRPTALQQLLDRAAGRPRSGRPSSSRSIFSNSWRKSEQQNLIFLPVPPGQSE